MRTVESKVRPDTLTEGDLVWSPISKYWEYVKSAYWSESAQRFVVWCGPLGYQLQLFGPSEKVWKRRYYFD